MVHTVDLPNGEPAEFPDTMSPDQIESIIQKQFPPAQNNNFSSGEMVNTALGQMKKPNIGKEITNPKLIDEMIRGVASTPANFGSIFGKGLLNKASSFSPILGNVLKGAEQPLLGAGIGAATNPEHPILGATSGASAFSLPMVGRGLGSASSIVRNAFNKISPEKIGQSIQSGHDILKKSAEDIFKNVGGQIKERNIPNFPIDKTLISSIAEHLPKDRATKKLLIEAESGEYGALRDLQSDLFHEGTLARKSDLSTERRSGKEMLDLRNRINESISNHLKNTGNEDLSKLLNEGMRKYKNVLDIYYAKKLPSAIKNMVHEESREIPNNIAQLMAKKSVPINKILAENPLAVDLSKKAIAHENALKKLKIIGGGTLALGSVAGLAGLPSLYHKVTE